MKTSILAAVLVLSAFVLPRTGFAAGQPQLSPEESARATEGKTPAQAAESRMDVKKEKDAGKYEGQAAQPGGQVNTGQVGNARTKSP